jgi:hypothetical protein
MITSCQFDHSVVGIGGWQKKFKHQEQNEQHARKGGGVNPAIVVKTSAHFALG